MRHVAVGIALLTLAVLAQPVGAQGVPDTTSAWRYVPLALGNVWTYDVRQIDSDCLPCQYLERWEVTGTITAGGRPYFEVSVRRTGVAPDYLPAEDTFYVRFDTTAAIAFRLNNPASPTSERPLDSGGCRLDEAFPSDPVEGRSIECSDFTPGEGLVFGGYEQPVTIGTSSYTLIEKSFSYFTFGYDSAAYAADVGLLRVAGCELCTYEAELLYALIDGTPYGTPPVSAESPTRGKTLAVAAYPSPTQGAVRLALSLAEPGAVSVSVFDLLGRQVYSTEGEFAATEGDIEFDAAEWAPGQYIVRLTSGSQVATTRFVAR